MENNSYLNCKKVDTAISRAKKILIDRAKTDGLYECFGQKEVRAIRDKFVDLCDYSKEMNTIRSKIDNFDEWCMTYTGQQNYCFKTKIKEEII